MLKWQERFICLCKFYLLNSEQSYCMNEWCMMLSLQYLSLSADLMNNLKQTRNLLLGKDTTTMLTLPFSLGSKLSKIELIEKFTNCPLLFISFGKSLGFEWANIYLVSNCNHNLVKPSPYSAITLFQGVFTWLIQD